MKKHRKNFKGMSPAYRKNMQRAKEVFLLRRWPGAFVLLAIILICAVILTNSPHTTFARQNKVNVTSSIMTREEAQLQAQMQQNRQAVSSKQASVTSPADTAQSCNDPGITDDTNTAAGNIDGAGYSYSGTAWDASYMRSSFSEGGLQFDLIDATHTDCISNGQVLPIANGTTSDVSLGLLGSATNGAVAGNATITYDDGSTQSFQLGFSDWTLGGGKQTPSYSNKIASAQLYRNTHQGQQSIKTFVFFTTVALQSGKKAINISMPKLTGSAQLHVFAWSTTSSSDANLALYNNVGSTGAAYTAPGNFDNAGNSYPIAGEDWTPGEQVGTGFPVETGFTASDVLRGNFDNIEASGQTIPLNAQGQSFGAVGFLGAASNGPSYGTAYVNYTDGTRQSFILGFSDWTLGGGKQVPSFSNLPILSLNYRNTQSGTQNIPVFLFKADVKVQANKIVQSVTLPTSTNQGNLHIFSTALFKQVSGNIGSTSDSAPLFGNLDGANHSYSEAALVNAHIPMSPITGIEHAFSFNGSIESWSTSSDAYSNNTIADGQSVNYDGDAANATDITFMGSATNGASSGTGVIHYTDGSTGTYTLQFSDWCATAPQFGNLVVASLPYRNTALGQQTLQNYVYYAEAPVDATKTVQSITLPQTAGGQMHIFNTGYRFGPHNNLGGDLDEDLEDINNFDGQNNGYSYDALQASGLIKGPVTINGVQFNWLPDQYSHADNYQASGQVITVTPVSRASTLAFLGASANGSSSGAATITYTDGTKQVFTLGLTDWASSTISFNNLVAGTAAYRHSLKGTQSIKTYIFYTDVALQPGKTIHSVSLPDNSHLHVFSIATK